MAKLSFFGGAGMVTGANYLVEAGNVKFLVDCGMIQGEHNTDQLNAADFLYNPAGIDFVLITHAHLDHVGRLTKLVHDGFSGKIYATAPSKELARLTMLDAVKIAREEAKYYPKRILFTDEDVQKVMPLFSDVEYGQAIKPTENISIIFHDAGHILGSSIIEAAITEGNQTKRIVFSGDVGNSPTPLLNNYEFLKQADIILVESAYGDRTHEPRAKRHQLLQETIKEVIKEKGTLLIPSFALERTQELLFELNELAEHKKIPRVPVFIDGPLSVEATAIYKKYQIFFNKEALDIIGGGDDIFKFPGLVFTKTPEESKKINDVLPPKIIIAGSGMSQGGRILHHELRYLPNPNNTILFITYQVRGTRGRRILDGEPAVHIFGQSVPVKIKVKKIGGYSAHADQPALLKWVGNFDRPIKKVFVVQGEPDAAGALAEAIKTNFNIDAKVPEAGESIDF